jgi:hypothetical protein
MRLSTSAELKTVNIPAAPVVQLETVDVALY